MLLTDNVPCSESGRLSDKSPDEGVPHASSPLAPLPSPVSAVPSSVPRADFQSLTPKHLVDSVSLK